MDVIGEPKGTEIAGPNMTEAARAAIRRSGDRPVTPVTPALPASLAALLLAHRIELEIDVCDLFDAQLRGAAPPLVDARIARAYRAGHIPGAVHMPSEAVTRAAVLALRPGPYIVVYGSDALRLDAIRTAHAIADMGFAVKLLSGGHAAWLGQGFPIAQPMRTEARIAAL